MAATDEMCRVSIRSAENDADFTLPAHLPIAEVLPPVVDLIGADGFDGRAPHLARVCGDPLDPATTLAQAAIQDGELLILTASVQPEPVRRFDSSSAVLDTVAGLTHPSWRVTRRRVGWVIACWAGAVLLALLGHAMRQPHATGPAAVGAAATLLTLAGAAAVHRVHRDRAAAVGLGVLATAFAGVSAALAAPGQPGLAGFLLAMSAMSMTSLLAWRLLGCAPLVFLPLAGVTMTASAAVVGAVARWWPVPAAGPVLATGSLAALVMSARLAVGSCGLSTAGQNDTEFEARTRTAHHRLTALVMAAAGAAALGAVVTAATTTRPLVAAGFITVVGAALALQAYRHVDQYHAAALGVSAGIVATALIGLCAGESPPTKPLLCGGVVLVGAGALWLGARRLSATSRRLLAVLDLAVGAAIVPAAAAAAGAFAGLPGMGLP
jgi:type VII secretion integral membrane protein EccD